MLNIENQTNRPINTEKIQFIYNKLTQKDLELIFVNNEQIQKINLEFRSKDYPTDVLSFPLENIPHAPLGSIVISIDKAIEVSQNLDHKLEDEISLLFIHGFLHLSGYDHEMDEGEMRKEEERLVKRFNLPKSLIVRNLT